MNDLGACYELGEGVAQDYSKAVVWYTKGAEMGDPIAMFDLAQCYAAGRGVASNESLCLQLVRASARGGYAPAKKALARIVQAQENQLLENIAAFFAQGITDSLAGRGGRDDNGDNRHQTERQTEQNLEQSQTDSQKR
jgi:TPR repeat protein